jgi:hypothetical protein
MMNASLPKNIWERNEELGEKLTSKPVTQILDHEKFIKTISNIFQRIDVATKNFQVRTIIFI